MTYKSQDKSLLLGFKEYLKQNVDPEKANATWSFYNKHLYLNDLYNYLRARLGGKVIETGYGNYNSEIAIVLDRIEDKKYLDFFKTLFPKIKVDFHQLFYTAFWKSPVDHSDIYREILSLEMKTVKPKLIFTFGDYGIDVPDCEICQLDKSNFDRMLSLMDQKERTPEEEAEMVESKQILWNNLRRIINYYVV